MTTYNWFSGPVPAHLLVRQVWGFCFDELGRVLLRLDQDGYGLPGGRPEPGEAEFADTLVRECLEETQTLLSQINYLGYQEVDDENGEPSYAQVRMIARITEIRPAAPDPDTGSVYGRLLTGTARAGELLAWGEGSRMQIAAAAALAQDWLGVPSHDPAADLIV